MTFRTGLATFRRAVLRRLVREQSGVTLTELLVTMAIMGATIAGVAMLFTSASRAELDLNERFQAQTDARVALDAMRREIHSACSATVSSTSVTLRSIDAASVGYACSGGYVSWCTVGSATRFGLYRATGATCNSSVGVRRADYLSSGAIFAYTEVTGFLPRLAVDMTVNVNPADVTRNGWRLTDAIALRNARRG